MALVSQRRTFYSIRDPEPISFGMTGLIKTLNTVGDNAPAWWSPYRDHYLRDEVIRNPFLDSLVSTITMKLMNLPFKIISKNSGIVKHTRLAKDYNDILQYSFMHEDTLERFVRSMLVADNGAFLYILGDAPCESPLDDLPTGLMYLDSTLVQRTGDEDYPIVYYNPRGGAFKIHESRYLSLTQSPSTDAQMYGVGYSFVSRASILSQHLLDIYIYEGEVLGSRSSEEILYATSARSEELKKAFDLADLDSDNEGLTKVAKRVYLGLRDPNAKLEKLNLKNLPENFMKRDDVEVTLTLIALASGGSPNWFYDSVRSGSTRASASESTKMGESKLESWFVNNLVNQLNYKFLPDALEVLGGNFDEDNNGVRARIKLNLAQTRRLNVDSKVTDLRTERQLQLHRNEITETQFEDLELRDGRTPGGLPIMSFYQTNDYHLRQLILFTDEPLNFTLNLRNPTILDSVDIYLENAQSVALNARGAREQRNGKYAMYLLEWTRKEYQKRLGIPVDEVINTGVDSIHEIMDDDNYEQDEEIDSEEESDTTASGINNEDEIDNDDDGQHTQPPLYIRNATTVKERKFKQEIRELGRKFWEGELDSVEFNRDYTDKLNEIFGVQKSKTISTYNIQSIKQKADGGKLKDIYFELDKWINYYK